MRLRVLVPVARWSVLATVLLIGPVMDARAQAVEMFAGHQAVTADVLFFSYFRNTAAQATPWLLFHRSRASIDYDIDTGAHRDLPQFGMTNAVSYNPAAWRGIGPVAAVSITTASVAMKVGAQYARVRPSATVFGWVVAETQARPAVDLFVLVRYIRPLSSAVGLFTQVEYLGVLTTDPDEVSSVTLRSRIGLAVVSWQVGVGADVRGSRTAGAATTVNAGVFLRHAF